MKYLKLFEKYKDQFLKMAEFYANRTRLYIITQNQYGQLMEYVTYVANPDTIIPNQTAQGTFNKSGFHFKRRSNNRYRPAGCNDCFGSKDSFGIGNAYQGFN